MLSVLPKEYGTECQTGAGKKSQTKQEVVYSVVLRHGVPA